MASLDQSQLDDLYAQSGVTRSLKRCRVSPTAGSGKDLAACMPTASDRRISQRVTRRNSPVLSLKVTFQHGLLAMSDHQRVASGRVAAAVSNAKDTAPAADASESELNVSVISVSSDTSSHRSDFIEYSKEVSYIGNVTDSEDTSSLGTVEDYSEDENGAIKFDDLDSSVNNNADGKLFTKYFCFRLFYMILVSRLSHLRAKCDQCSQS